MGPLRAGNPLPHPPFLPSSISRSLSLSLAKQIRSQRKGNARDERAKGVTNSGD